MKYLQTHKMKKDIIIITGLFSVAFLIRVANVSNVCLYSDEYLYQLRAFTILANNWDPTAEPIAEMFKGAIPFISYIGAAVTLLFGGNLSTLKIFSVIFGSLTVPFLYLFGKAIYNRKTGLLASLFMCFSTYHSLYSRIFMCEALTIFFITTFLWLFCLSQRLEGKKSTIYACFAGAMMGLAIDIKYISLFLIPAALAYVLWTKSFSFKALINKKIILIFIFAVLFAAPLLIGLYITDVGLYPIYHYSIEKYGIREGYPQNIRVLSFSPNELLVRGIGGMLGALAWNAWLLPLYWEGVFLLSLLLLFLIIFPLYLFEFLSKNKSGSFLMIFLITLCIPLFFSAKLQYYLNYLLIFLYIMFSHLAIKSFEFIKKENVLKSIFGFIIILLTLVVLFSYFVTGVFSPYFGDDEFSWTKRAVKHIESDIIRSGYKGDIVIGTFSLAKEPLEYQVYLSGINASTISFLKRSEGYKIKRKTIDLDTLDRVKPNYLVVNDLDYGYYFNKDAIKKILTDYRVIFFSHNYYNKLDSHTKVLGYRIFKRTEMQPHGLLFPIGDKEGEISEDIFKKSIPSVMKVGRPYTVLVQVKNTGNSRTNFTVRVYSEKFIIAGAIKEITLNKGSTRLLKLKIVPFEEYVGELPITAELYAKHEKSMKKVDSVSDFVYRIEK